MDDENYNDYYESEEDRELDSFGNNIQKTPSDKVEPELGSIGNYIASTHDELD
jgi:hypothetical protein